ncbi:MAG: hypothetical protein KDK56_00365 [Simkania sp.]|nr:hypothetical protein [Simkania sp.]MCB1076054.1 hypothetical protein [Simkania sp.]MCP5491288.1 hypothetical protein [Chlamydiales bacterium]
MISENLKIQVTDLAKTTTLQFCTGALISKIFFPVVVKEGAVFCAVMGATMQFV